MQQRIHELLRSFANHSRIVGRNCQRRLAGVTGKFRCLDNDIDRKRPDSVRLKPLRDAVRQLSNNGQTYGFIVGIAYVLAGRRLIGVTLCLLADGFDRRSADTVCIIVQILCALVSENTSKKPHIGLGKFPYGPNPHTGKLLSGLTPAAEKAADRKRPELCLNLIRVERVYFIRLLKVTRHLGQDLVRGYSDVYSKTQSIADLILYMPCRAERVRLTVLDLRSEQMRGVSHIEKSLINGYLLDFIRIFFQNTDKISGVLAVCRPVTRNEDQLRTLLQR